MPLSEEFILALQNVISGEVRVDLPYRLLYSTDASIYQIEPLGVVFPRNPEDLIAVIEIAARYNMPVLARGSGSSLAGQAIGPALIIDCSRYLNHILEVDLESNTAVVEPGVILSSLNKNLAKYYMQFGPDPASAERATMGGSLANNATGAHSIIYGMAADHILSADVVLADGSQTTLSEINLEEANRLAGISEVRDQLSLMERDVKPNNLVTSLYTAIFRIRENYQPVIQRNWSRVWRRAAGYNLNYLIPWSPSQPQQWSGLPYPPIRPGHINPAQLLAGSEGTLAILKRLTVRIVPKPKYTILGVLAFSGISEACDTVPSLLEFKPSAIELIPHNLIKLARSLPAYAHQISVIDPLRYSYGGNATLLVVEFSGDTEKQVDEQIKYLGDQALIAKSSEAQKQVWAIRTVGLGILMSRPGDTKPVAFIEDLSVPVEHLGNFTREMERIMASYGVEGDLYAHASVGCLHIRPLINLKTRKGVEALRGIAVQAADLTISLGGAVSGEHSLGLSRGEWLSKFYHPELVDAFRLLKKSVDPMNILNPGKMIDTQPMDVNLRYGIGYQGKAWQPIMDFTRNKTSPEGLAGAIEQCNGAGVCRKSEGVMCPSFQATQDEMYSTRGRANLLRAMISGRFPDQSQGEQAVRQALDLCLACKGCKAECPSGVDVAKLKYEFSSNYYRRHNRQLRDYLFGYIGLFARIGSTYPTVMNLILSSPVFKWVGKQWLGLSPNRSLPKLAQKPLQRLGLLKQSIVDRQAKVLFLNDSFTEYFYPEAGESAISALQECGFSVKMIPILGSGRTLISKGYLRIAKTHALRLVEYIKSIDPQGGIPVIGVEPSEIYSLCDEYLDFFPEDLYAKELAKRTFMIDEFLIRPGDDDKVRIAPILTRAGHISNIESKKVLLHGHCYQKARPPAADGYPVGASATVDMLRMAGYQVDLIETGCCGMAGAFGYEKEHYDLSIKIGEMSLFPSIRQAGDQVIIAASGVSCQAQIEDGTGRKTRHPITLII